MRIHSESMKIIQASLAPSAEVLSVIFGDFNFEEAHHPRTCQDGTSQDTQNPQPITGANRRLRNALSMGLELAHDDTGEVMKTLQEVTD